MAENQITLESLQKSIEALEAKIVTEDRIKAIVGESTAPAATAAVKSWATSDEGKKIIGGEASRITMEALANVGTTPAKPAPVGSPGNDTPESQAAVLISQGKFEEAYAMDKNLRAEFPTAKSYAAYMRAAGLGAVRITTKAND